MIFKATNSRWQTVIADLSLILFLVAASALEDELPGAEETQEETKQVQDDKPPAEIAMSIWQDDPRGISLTQWLTEQPNHDEQRLSITLEYKAGGLAEALTRLEEIQSNLGSSSENARILISEGPTDSLRVRLVQDDTAPIRAQPSAQLSTQNAGTNVPPTAS